MKKIIFGAILLCACLGQVAHAQVVRVNIGVQPVWGPTGYDYVNYYYIPDIDAYYDVNARQYTYMDRGRWITTPGLPPRYANFNLYGAYKAVINEPTPWMYHDRYRRQYAQYRGRHDQMMIRDSHEPKYWANPGHPEHNKWHGDNGHHDDHRNDHGHDGDHHHDDDRR